jgi:hypothetical protein
MKTLARTCETGVMDGERIAARLFVGLGGIIWIGLAIGSAFVYGTPNPSALTIQITLPIVLAVVAFVVGWFYENAAALLLFAGAIATIVWGVVAGWEAGVWGLMALVLIAPEIIAGLLFLMAAQMQDRCLMESEGRS